MLYAVAAILHLPRLPVMWALLFGGCAIVVADIHLDWTHLTQYRIVYHLFFFFLGSLLCQKREKLESQKLLGISVMFLVTAACCYIFLYARFWYGNWKVLIAAATCYVFVYQFHRSPQLAECRLFQICGKYCLELYLLHTFFTAGLRSLLPLVGITTPWLSVWVNFLLSTGISLLLACLAGKTWVMDVIFRPARFCGELLKRIRNA